MPKSEDVMQVEFTNNESRYQTRESLLRMMPHLTEAKLKKTDYPKFQYGTITMRDGTILKWRSSWLNNVVFYNDQIEQSYIDDDDAWTLFSNWIFSIIALISFAVGLMVFNEYKKSCPESNLIRAYNFINEYRLGNIFIRLLLASLLFYLGYMLLTGPLREISDGVVLHSGKGGSHIYFADTEPKTFWFEISFDAIFGIMAILVGLGFISINPKSKFWSRKIKSSPN